MNKLFTLAACCASLLSNLPATAPPLTAPYGTWDSPITAEACAEGSNSIQSMVVDQGATYLLEMRPSNQGRSTVVRRTAEGVKEDLTPPDFNVQSFVHEYGGGAFTVSNGTVFASNADNHAIYKIKPGAAPEQLTEGQTLLENGQWKGTRFGDLTPTPRGLLAIGETHNPNQPEQNFIALIDVTSGNWKTVVSGYDFYSSPAISRDGKHLAWICWNHPHMPWTDTELWVGEWNDAGEFGNVHQIGGSISESFFQPQWSNEGVLYFITDRENGWWNLHRYLNGQIENLLPLEAEAAESLWSLGLSTYAFLGNQIVLAYTQGGVWDLGLIDLQSKKYRAIERRSSWITQVRSAENGVLFLEYSPNQGAALLQIDETGSICTLNSPHSKLDPQSISSPQHIAFPSHTRTAYGFYYPPCNPRYKAPENEKPPLIVMVHGGPTWQTSSSFSLEKQFWTSRGFALLDVNYGGSTGYGRPYRELLNHNWGIVDLEDCVNGALFLAKIGLVDGNKMVIRGGSSGGYTSLAALAFSTVFKAGASYYGIADLTRLAQESHKFERRYMELLIGKYPEEEALFNARSPLSAVHQIQSPLILFQGEEDRIVPKNQSTLIYESLKARGIAVDLHIYPGEGHGFRQAKHIAHSLNSELEFYRKTLGLI